MKRLTPLPLIIASIILVGLSQCSSPVRKTNPVRNTHQPARPTAAYHTGVVRSSYPTGSRRTSGFGHAVGSLGGAILGSHLGSGYSANLAGSLAGSLLGGAGGDLAEAKTRKRKHRVSIESNGRLYITIANSHPPFFKGDQVRFYMNSRGRIVSIVPLKRR